jgi:hypothetical protein
MKKMASFPILLGSGLAAFGISGFGGSFSSDRLPGTWSGSFGWPLNYQIGIVAGVVFLALGLLLRSSR